MPPVSMPCLSYRPVVSQSFLLFLCLAAMKAGPVLAADAWPLQVSGDARVRYETIEVDPGGDVERERYRARLALRSWLSDALSLDIRLATGTGDPVSTNLNFGTGFSLEDVQLDRAYLDLRVNDAVHLFAGKMKNPLFRPGGTSLNWDSDLNPKGVAASFDNGAVFGNLAAFHLADQPGADSALFATQVGTHWGVGSDDTITAGLGYYDYRHARGNKPFYRGLAAGNTVDQDGNYLYDYNVAEAYAEFATTLRHIPVRFFADRVQNLAVSRENTAYAVGIDAGSTDERHGIAASWVWHDTDADALIGTFSDSDFGGGNTDSRGQVIQLSYALTDHLVAGGTLILSEFGRVADQSRDYDRVMLDLEFHF